MSLNSVFFLVLNQKLEGELCNTFPVSSPVTPNEGWALFARTAPARLDPLAREFLVALFESGRADRNSKILPSNS